MRFSLKLTLVGLAWISPLRADAAFTLDQIFEQAIKKSETLGLGQLEIERQQAASSEIETRKNPRVRMSGEFDRVYSKLGDQNVLGQWQPRLLTEIRQPLYEGGSIKAQMNSLEQSTAAARWDLQGLKEDLYRQMGQLFYQIISAEQDLINLRESERIYRGRVKTLESRARIGKSRSAEVLSARTQMDAISAQIKASASQRDIAQRRLAYLAGTSAPLELSDRLSLSESSIPNNNQKPIASVQAAQARIALADSLIEEKRSAARPRVDLIAQHNWRYPFPDDQQFNSLSFGVGLTWTLYDAGETDAAIRTAVIDKTKASLTETLQTRESKLALDQAQQAYQDGLEQIRLYDKALEAAEKNVRIQQQEFENGLLTNLEVMQALDTRLQIKRNRDRALYQAKLAKVEALLLTQGLPQASTP